MKSPLRVTLETQKPLPVRMEEESAESVTWAKLLQALRSWWMITLLAIAFVAFTLWAIFLFPHAYPTLDCEEGVMATLTHPRFLSTGDKGQVVLTIQSEATSTLTATVVVDFLGPLPVRLEEDEASDVQLVSFPPGGERGASIPFHISRPPLWFRRGAVDFAVRIVEAGKVRTCATPNGEEIHRITLAPIHNLAAILRWLFSSISLVSLLSEWLKKRLLALIE